MLVLDRLDPLLEDRLVEVSVVGLQTAPPPEVPPETNYLGSPPMAIARAPGVGSAAERRLTFEPSRLRLCGRAAFELFGWLLLMGYASAYYALTFIALDWGLAFGEEQPVLYALAVPCVVLGIGALMLCVVAASKWLIMCGRFREGHFPLWTLWVWRTELVERLEENLAEPLLLDALSGTCLKPLFYRCMGARLGRRPYLERAVLTEPDLLRVGDHVTIENGGTLQAHLFQDRVRTVRRIEVGDSCSIGSNSVVLLGGRMDDNSHLLPLSLVLREERMPSGEWHGSPAVPREIYRLAV